MQQKKVRVCWCLSAWHAFNGHVGDTCYHILFLLSQELDLARYFRVDGGLGVSRLMEDLKIEGYPYAIRTKLSAILQAPSRICLSVRWGRRYRNS